MGSYLDLNPLPGIRSKFKLPGETDALYWGIIDVQMSLQAIIKKIHKSLCQLYFNLTPYNNTENFHIFLKYNINFLLDQRETVLYSTPQTYNILSFPRTVPQTQTLQVPVPCG